jgi:hypothetical protein
MTDDYEGFLEWRLAYLAKELQRATAHQADGTSSELSISELLARGEGDHLEFKSSGRFNVHTQGRDPRIEHEVVLTVAGFLNADGDDRYQLWLQDLLSSHLQTPSLVNVTISFADLDGRIVCRIDVRRSSVPVFAKAQNGTGDEFYVRMGNSTRRLTMTEYETYRRGRW